MSCDWRLDPIGIGEGRLCGVFRLLRDEAAPKVEMRVIIGEHGREAQRGLGGLLRVGRWIGSIPEVVGGVLGLTVVDPRGASQKRLVPLS